MKFNRKKHIIIWSVVIVVLLGTLAAVFFMFGGLDKLKNALQPQAQGPEIVTVEGTIQCLPNKDDGEVHTLECALGMKTTDGAYYGLSNSDETVTSEAGTDTTLRITGELDPQTSDTYEMEGVIAVTTVEVVR